MDINPDDVREVARNLERTHSWLVNNVAYADVSLCREEYFDLGTFGEQSTEIEISEDDYEVDPQPIFDQGPVDSSELTTMAAYLNELADAIEESKPSLDTVLDDMLTYGDARQKALAVALASVAQMHVTTYALASNGNAVRVVPDRPLPWPGALNPDIDYAADDFPLRYQPPPGYDWANIRSNSVPYDAAEKVASSIKAAMILDPQGRVRWMAEAPDTTLPYEGWRVWHMGRDGIPEAAGFHAASQPRAIDEGGLILDEPWSSLDDYDNWNCREDYDKAHSRLVALREEVVAPSLENGKKPEFEAPAPVSL